MKYILLIAFFGVCLVSPKNTKAQTIVADTLKVNKYLQFGGGVGTAFANSSIPYIYRSIPTTGGSYPFNGTGHLVLQSRSSIARDIVFLTGTPNPIPSMTIKSSGYIGIGTVNPATPLSISAENWVEGPAVPKVLAVSDPSDATKTISLGYDDVNDAGVLVSVDLGTGWKNTLIQPYGGNVGIGTTSPSQKLELYSSGTNALRLSTNSHSNDQKIEFYVATNAYHSIVSNTQSGNLQIRAGDGGSGHEIYFYTDGIGRAGVSSTGGMSIGDTYFNDVVPANQFVVEDRIGIGTNSPQAALEVNDGTLLVSGGSALGQGDARFIVDTQNSTAHVPMILRNDNGTLFRVNGNGYVGIGTASPTSKLTVAGTVKSKEIIVEETAGADFVFEEDYDLPTLSQIEKFIKANKHLEGIASAEDMKTNGVKVGELQIQLLQKIEELTLYVIDLDKKNSVLQKENTQLKKQESINNTQQEAIEQLLSVNRELLKRIQKLENKEGK